MGRKILRYDSIEDMSTRKKMNMPESANKTRLQNAGIIYNAMQQGKSSPTRPSSTRQADAYTAMQRIKKRNGR